jgi:DNA polymerase-3 subunit alpha
MTLDAFTKKFKKIDLPLHGVRLPSFQISDSLRDRLDASKSEDNVKILRRLCYEGYERRMLSRELDPSKAKEYTDRAEHELETMEELGFVDYMLLTWDVINFCKESDIPVGLGRGSAAGSFVLYLLGVTNLDPIKYGLFFERFISKIRAKKKVVDGVTYLDGSLMVDIDNDVCYYNRHKVLEYIDKKFKGKTAKILTLNTLSGKLLTKECGKIIASKSEVEMNLVSSYVPKLFGQVKDLEEAYDEVTEFREWCDEIENKEAYNIALKLRGLIKNKSVHASGILLSYDKLEDSCPVELTSDKAIVSSFDMGWVSLFNVKLDILGLRSVSVVDDVCRQIGIKNTEIDINDPEIYRNLQDLETPHGLFQIEADTNYRVCQKVKPKNLEELSAVLALGRPGALAFVDQYARYANHDIYEPIHPLFDDILKGTGGVALYQEQMMQMAHKVGFTLDEAEILRRIVGKKKVKEVRQWKKKIREKVEENRLSDEWTGGKGNVDVGDVLWGVLEDSANYSFNKAHSICYAALAAITTYLKFKHPKEFFLSLLKMTRHEPDPLSEINKIQVELGLFGIKLLPPHITKSKMDFCIEGDNIRYGLTSIKGISDKTIEKLNNFRAEFTNKFEVFQAASEAKVGIGVLSALIQAGAFEGFPQSRSKIVLEAQLWNILTQREKRTVYNLGEKFDFNLIKIIKNLVDRKDEDGKVYIKASRFETIKRKYAPYKEIYNQNSKSESLANWYYEKKLLGYSHANSLRTVFSQSVPGLQSVREVNSKAVGERVIFVSTIDDYFKGKSKRGSTYIRLTNSDETGVLTALQFNHKIEESKLINGGRVPAKEDIVIIRGLKKDDAVFIDNIGIQSQKIFTKLSELKDIT